jgi:hypothetical protein
MNWINVGPISSDYKAQPWEHILVNFNEVQPVDLFVSLPDPGIHGAGTRVRVSDVSADGGLGNGHALRLVGTFYPLPGGHFAGSGYVVASDGADPPKSRRGANIELLYKADDDGVMGWLVIQEGCQPMSLPFVP